MDYNDLLEGIKSFQDTVYSEEKELFEKLSKGQSPKILFITCSDSRIDPGLLAGSQPGDLFIVRNAGNMVPLSNDDAGELATIEYACAALGVEHIVVCGHSGCGAMNALISEELPESLPHVTKWLSNNLSDLRDEMLNNNGHASLDSGEKLKLCVEKNVIVQIENLKKIDAVKAKLDEGKLQLHGWYYDIGAGEVRVLQ